MDKNEWEGEKTTHAPTKPVRSETVCMCVHFWTYWVSNRFTIVFFFAVFFYFISFHFMSFFVPYFFFSRSCWLLRLMIFYYSSGLLFCSINRRNELEECMTNRKKWFYYFYCKFSPTIFSSLNFLFVEWNLIWNNSKQFFRIEKNEHDFTNDALSNSFKIFVHQLVQMTFRPIRSVSFFLHGCIINCFSLF